MCTDHLLAVRLCAKHLTLNFIFSPIFGDADSSILILLMKKLRLKEVLKVSG